MLLKISWNNVWRNKMRSLVLIISIILGMWAGVFVMAFYTGIIEQRISNVIESEVGHFQFHVPAFKEDNLVNFFIPLGDEMIKSIKEDTRVKAVTGRVVVMGMIGSAKTSSGIKMNGIIPGDEIGVNGMDKNITEGDFFSGDRKNTIVISTKTAAKLNLKLRSKLVLTFQDLTGEIISAAFRVGGLYKSTNGMYDEMNVFVRKEDIQSLLGSGVTVHEIAVLLKDHAFLPEVLDKYKSQYADLLIESWMQLSPGMEYMVDSMDLALYIMLWIIMLALLFGIVNTMLMAVLERTREIGMLMAVGMNKFKIFGMILFETLFLILIGGPTGLFLAYLTVYHFGRVGIDLSIIGEALGNLGYGSVIYPTLGMNHYFNVIGQVILMALVGSLYPARKALKLNPVEAIRKI